MQTASKIKVSPRQIKKVPTKALTICMFLCHSQIMQKMRITSGLLKNSAAYSINSGTHSASIPLGTRGKTDL
jgi:hypothetical protein